VPNLKCVDSRAVLDVALSAIEESLEGVVGSSLVFSLPGGVDSPCRDTTCPVQPDEHPFTPEAPEGSPTPADILVVSSGASVPSFPMEPRTEVLDCPAFAPAIRSLIAQLDKMEVIAVHQQRMSYQASYSRFQMRRSLHDLAKFTGVEVRQSNLGCQCLRKH